MFLIKIMVEAAARVELDSPYFPQIVVCRAFLLILKQLEHFLQSSINKISSIIPSKIKIFYTKFTPRVKFLKSHITILKPKTCQMIFTSLSYMVFGAQLCVRKKAVGMSLGRVCVGTPGNVLHLPIQQCFNL